MSDHSYYASGESNSNAGEHLTAHLRRDLGGRRALMNCRPYSQLVAAKLWADRGLYDVVGQNLDQLTNEDTSILLRILDHMHAVDRIFQHHLQGLPHTFKAPRSDTLPDLRTLANSVREIDDWYACYVDNSSQSDFEQPVEFVFTNGSPARMRRGE